MRRILRLTFWIALIASFALAVLPHPPALPGDPSDKIQHILAFGVLAALGAIAFPTMPLAWLIGWLAAFGGLIELTQAIPALNRSSEFADFIADALAAATSGIVTRFAMRNLSARAC